MPSDNEELSGSDSDDGLDEDIEALRRACILTGTNPNDLQTSSALTATTVAPHLDGGAAYESEEDDLELVRKIQQRFSIPTDAEEPLTLKPLCSLPPIVSDDDYEEDFETLRAIQRRFSDYNNDNLKDSTDDCLRKPEQVGATNIDLEKETSNNLFVDRTNIGERFPDCVDASISTHISQSFNDNVPRMQPSGLIEWHESGAENAATSPVRDSGFPKSAQAFVDAIKKNRSCQKFLRNKLMQIEARIEENKKLRERVKILKDFQVTCRKRTGRALSQKKDARVQLISVPKLRDNSKVNEKKVPAMYYGPAENSHVANYRMALTKFPLSLSQRKWSKEEKENLAKGIKQQFQEMLLQKSINFFSDAEGFSGDSNGFDSMIVSIRDLDITPENIRLFLPKVNWDQLASMYVTGRSGAECEARWLNCEDPIINQHPWTKMEDKNLLHIVQQRGISNWIDIAVSLGTNRTPFQCLARYQRSLNASIMKREWTEDEDDKLRSAVAAFGESDWQLIASTLEGRTGTQCSNRWKKSLHPTRLRVGTWTSDEDKCLEVAVMLFGAKNWKKIAQFVPGRTQVQCRERWVNCLDPSLNLGEWTEEEDSRLKDAISELGFSWSKVAACVPPRTDSQCRRRWKVLFPHEVPLLRAARNMQKAALISNFVDRESERPALGPNDFVPLMLMDSVPESENVIPCGKQKRKSRRMPKHNENDISTGHVPKVRSKRPRKEAHVCSNEVLRLTNGSGFENFGGGDDISRKKRVRNPSTKNRKTAASTQDLLPPFPDTMLLEITNGEEVGACGSDSARKKKNASGGQKRKSGVEPEYEEIGTAPGHDAILKKKRARKPCSNGKDGSDPRIEDAGELGGDDATKNKKASKPIEPESNEIDAAPGHDAILKKKRARKPCSKGNDGSDPRSAEAAELGGDDATKTKKAPKSVEPESREIDAAPGHDAILKKKRARKPCSKGNGVSDPRGEEAGELGEDDATKNKKAPKPVEPESREIDAEPGHDAILKKKRARKPCSKGNGVSDPRSEEAGKLGGNDATKNKKAPKPVEPESREIDTEPNHDAILKKKRARKQCSKGNGVSDPRSEDGGELGGDDTTRNKNSPKPVEPESRETDAAVPGHDAILKKKRARKACSKGNGISDPRSEDGGELGGDDATRNKKAPKPVEPESRETDAAPGHDAILKKKRARKACSKGNGVSDPRSEDGGELGGDDATRNKKAPKPVEPESRETDAVLGDDAILKKKRARKACSKGNRASDPRREEAGELGRDGDATRNKKAPKPIEPGSRERDAAPGHDAILKNKRARKACSKGNRGSDPRSEEARNKSASKSVEPGSRETEAASGHDAILKNRFIGQLEDVQVSPNFDEVEVVGGDGASSTKKRREIKPCLKKKETLKPCLRSECPDHSIVSQSLPSLQTSLEIRMANGEGVVAFDGNSTALCERPPMCSTPDILDSGNTRTSGRLQNEPKRSSTRESACSNPMLATEDEDDMTLASFFHETGNHQKSAWSSEKVSKLPSKLGGSTKIVDGSQNNSLRQDCSTSDIPGNGISSASFVCEQNRRPKRSTNGSSQMSEAENVDDTTLAFYYRNLKKRRLELAKNGKDAYSPCRLKRSVLLSVGTDLSNDVNSLPQTSSQEKL